MQRPVTIYSMAIVALAAAWLLRWLLDPLMGNSLPVVTLFGAVAFAVWVGGYRPAVLVAAFGYLACAYLFIEPRGRIGFADFQNIVGLVAYAFMCSLIIGIGEAMRLAQMRASERGESMRVTLSSIGDAVITTDVEGRVTYLNAVAEGLTGWSHQEALKQPLDTVFRIVNEQSREPPESPVTRALREGGVVGLANHTILIAKSGVERPIDDSAAPIRNEHGLVSGCVLIFRDISDRRRWEKDAADRLLAARRLASIVDHRMTPSSASRSTESFKAGTPPPNVYSGTRPNRLSGATSRWSFRPSASRRKTGSLEPRGWTTNEHFETEWRRSDGKLIMVRLRSRLSRTCQATAGASNTVRDVTRQRQAEERERQSLAEAAPRTMSSAHSSTRAHRSPGSWTWTGRFSSRTDSPGRLRLCERTDHRQALWEGPWWTPSAELVDDQGGSAEPQPADVRAEVPYFLADGSWRLPTSSFFLSGRCGPHLVSGPDGDRYHRSKVAEAEREKFVTWSRTAPTLSALRYRRCPALCQPGRVEDGGTGQPRGRAIRMSANLLPGDQPRIMDQFFRR